MNYKPLIIFCLFVCCKAEKSDMSPETEIVEIPQNFISFYEEFHADSSFQMNHITFPLSQKDSLSKWQKEEWILHKGFDNHNGSYSREFDNFEGIIIETIRESNNAFVIQRRFAPMGDSYSLIYYTIENQLENWGQRILSDSLAQADSINID